MSWCSGKDKFRDGKQKDRNEGKATVPASRFEDSFVSVFCPCVWFSIYFVPHVRTSNYRKKIEGKKGEWRKKGKLSNK